MPGPNPITLGTLSLACALIGCGEPLAPAPRPHQPSLSNAGVTYAIVVDAVVSLDATASTGEAVDINADGHIVGWRVATTNAFLPRATRWDGNAPGSFADIGTLGGPTSKAAAINDEGAVVGDADVNDYDTRAFLWRPAVGIVDISPNGVTFPGGTVVSRLIAKDINNWGVIAGRAIGGPTFNLSRAFTLDVNAITLHAECGSGTDNTWANAINNANELAGVVIGTTPGGNTWLRGGGSCWEDWHAGAAHDLNDDHVAVGGYNASGQPERAYRWTQATGRVSIHPANDPDASRAYGINNGSLIVGMKQGAVARPFVWHPQAGMKVLPSLRPPRCGPTAVGEGVAYKVNDAGWIVGASNSCGGKLKPTLWKVHVQASVLNP